MTDECRGGIELRDDDGSHGRGSCVCWQATRVEPGPVGSVPPFMAMRFRLPLPLLLALVFLAACGGSGPRGDDGAVYCIEPPDDPRDVAIAVRPDGEVVVRKGLNEKDRAAGRTFPSRDVSSWSARHARIEAHVGQPWVVLHRALDRVVSRGTTLVTLGVHEPGAPSRTLSFATGAQPGPRSPDRQLLRLAFVIQDGALCLEAGFSDGPWLRRHGCGAVDTLSWAWDGGRALVPVRSLVLDFEALCGATLDVRVEVPGLRWPSSAPNPDAPEPTRPTVAEVADLLEELVQTRITFVDLAMHSSSYPGRARGLVEEGLSWLAAHQSPDGGWDADGFATWCHGKPISSDDPGDGHAHFDTGATSLALVAFLGAGYTNRGRHPFARTVSAGFRRLTEWQTEDGIFDPPRTLDRARSHALATLALSRVYGMTGSPLWKYPARRALAALPAIWRDEGGDALSTAATVLAVEAARLAIADAEKRGKPLPWTLDDAFIGELHGACRALARGSTHLDAATGIAGCLVLGDDPNDATWNTLVTAAAPADPNMCDPRTLYLYLLAAHRLGGPAKATWQAMWKREFKSHVRPGQDGHKCCLDGSWGVPEGYVLPGGRIEATAAWLMAGEVYYRYDKVLR